MVIGPAGSGLVNARRSSNRSGPSYGAEFITRSIPIVENHSSEPKNERLGANQRQNSTVQSTMRQPGHGTKEWR